MSELLPQSFFDRDARTLSRALLGQHIRRDDVVVRITEVEAYLGPHDSAAHSRAGRTARTAPLFGPPGHVYVYLVYGLHHLLNLVAGPDGSAVLVRACEPVEGEPIIAARRGGRSGPGLLDGPGKVGQALALDTTWSTHAAYEPGGLELIAGVAPPSVLVGPRVGIDYAAPHDRDAPLRFAVPGSRWVSHRRKLRPEASPPPR